MYYIFIHSSVNRYLGCFHVLAIVNGVAINSGVHVSFQIRVFSRYIQKSGIVGSYGGSIFSHLRNHHTVLHSGCTNLFSSQECRRVSFFPHRLKHLCFVDLWWPFWTMWVDRYLIVVLIRISLVISNVEIFLCACWPSVECGRFLIIAYIYIMSDAIKHFNEHLIITAQWNIGIIISPFQKITQFTKLSPQQSQMPTKAFWLQSSCCSPSILQGVVWESQDHFGEGSPSFKLSLWTSVVIQWLRFFASTAGGTGLTTDQENYTCCLVQPFPPKKKPQKNPQYFHNNTNTYLLFLLERLYNIQLYLFIRV